MQSLRRCCCRSHIQNAIFRNTVSDSMSEPSTSARAGGHRGGPSSISALVSTLVPCILLAAALVGAFLLLRNKQRRLYAPRTYHDTLLDEYALLSFRWTEYLVNMQFTERRLHLQAMVSWLGSEISDVSAMNMSSTTIPWTPISTCDSSKCLLSWHL
jgi:hypothetical protein